MEPRKRGSICNLIAEEVNSSRKRKMKWVAKETNQGPFSIPKPTTLPISGLPYYHPLRQPPNFPSMNFSNPFRLDLNTPPCQSLSEASSMLTHFKSSFMSLLAGAEDDLLPFVKEQNAHLDKLITAHGDQLKQMIRDVQRRQYRVLEYEADERAAKRLKERELELINVGMGRRNADSEDRESMLQKENQGLQNKIKFLEQLTTSLRAQLQESMLLGGKMEAGACSGQEDVESVHVDPERLEPILLACKACGKRATVMMWPCRHFCACANCDPLIRVCPVCSVTKSSSFEVCLP